MELSQISLKKRRSKHSCQKLQFLDKPREASPKSKTLSIPPVMTSNFVAVSKRVRSGQKVGSGQFPHQQHLSKLNCIEMYGVVIQTT